MAYARAGLCCSGLSVVIGAKKERRDLEAVGSFGCLLLWVVLCEFGLGLAQRVDELLQFVGACGGVALVKWVGQQQDAVVLEVVFVVVVLEVFFVVVVLEVFFVVVVLEVVFVVVVVVVGELG